MGSTSVSSYSFYKPVFASLVTSFKTSSENSAKYSDSCSLGYQQTDCFTNNFFLSGEKSIRVKPKGNNQIFGLEGTNKLPVKDKDHKFKSIDSYLLQNKRKKSSTYKRDNDKKVIQKVKKKPSESVIVTSSKTHQVHELRPSQSSSTQSGAVDSTVTRGKLNKTKHTCQEFCKLKRYHLEHFPLD